MKRGFAMQNKALSLLGFARKAGRLAVGMQAAVESAKRGKAALVLVSREISEKSRKEICFHCEKHSIKFAVTDLGIYDITQAIGTKAGIVAIEDEGFAAAIAKNIT